MARVLPAAGLVALTFGAAVAIAPAGDAAPVTPSATAYSSSAATSGGSMAATLALTGAVGGLLDGLVSPIVNNALNPLVNALQGSANGVFASSLGSASVHNATSPTQQSTAVPGTFPGDLPGGLPNPCGATSVSLPCYKASTVGLSAAPLSVATTGSLAGYTEQVDPSKDASAPILGRAQVTSPTVSVLSGITSLTDPVSVTAGLVDSKAACPNAGSTTPSASVSATNVSLLGGKITFAVLNGSITNLAVNGTPYTLANLPVVRIGTTTVQGFGTAIRVDIPLTLAQLVQGLALPSAAVTELTGDLVSSSLKLSLIVGPSVAVTATSAKAWGLGIGADLSGSISFSLAGLVGATVSVGSGIGGGNYGNVLDLRLGYSACQSGSAASSGPTPAIPPALV